MGVLSDTHSFTISRGVRQGDVLSPLLFNVVLDEALSNWKGTIGGMGLALSIASDVELLTNVRYADDLLLFAKSEQECSRMLSCLMDALAGLGLELNAKKTKIFTTEPPLHSKADPQTVKCGAVDVEFIATDEVHKYLGRAFSGDLRRRASSALKHRNNCAWMKWNHLRESLVDRRVNVKLRLRLFDAVISPTVLYGLDTAAMTASMLDSLDALQRQMLRRVVGRNTFVPDDWAENGRRLKARVEAALALHPVDTWTVQLESRRRRLFLKIICQKCSQLLSLVYDWNPVSTHVLNRGSRPRRNVGRPQTRWIDMNSLRVPHGTVP